jgi:5-methylcytosine-specific restriction endonuclease McrA
METLVLNISYMPIDRVPWTEAVVACVTGRAEIVEAYPNALVRSAHQAFPMPSIIRFVTRAVFRQRQVRFNRHNVWLRDKGICQFCGEALKKAEFTYDHVVPQSRGGRTIWTNIVCACMDCNRLKANRTPEEAKMRLLAKPVVPLQLPGQLSPLLTWREGMPLAWRDYLQSYRYWHQTLDSE